MHRIQISDLKIKTKVIFNWEYRLRQENMNGCEYWQVADLNL